MKGAAIVDFMLMMYLMPEFVAYYTRFREVHSNVLKVINMNVGRYKDLKEKYNNNLF